MRAGQQRLALRSVCRDCVPEDTAINITDAFRHAALFFPNKTALIFGDMSYTYSAMNRVIDAVASYLLGRECPREIVSHFTWRTGLNG